MMLFFTMVVVIVVVSVIVVIPFLADVKYSLVRLQCALLALQRIVSMGLNIVCANTLAKRYAFFFVRVDAGLYVGLSSPAEPHHRADDARNDHQNEDGGAGVEVGCRSC